MTNQNLWAVEARKCLPKTDALLRSTEKHAAQMYAYLRQLSASSTFAADTKECECGQFEVDGYCQDVELEKLLAAIEGVPARISQQPS